MAPNEIRHRMDIAGTDDHYHTLDLVCSDPGIAQALRSPMVLHALAAALSAHGFDILGMVCVEEIRHTVPLSGMASGGMALPGTAVSH